MTEPQADGMPKREQWGTRIGVILAVTGSAVGLGNFLRFPGLAAEYGGGAFMIPYIVAFLILGLPIAMTEWALGRYGGTHGRSSCPGIFAVVSKGRGAPYLGVLGPLIPVMIYMYYVFIEAWCLGYAWKYLTGFPKADNPGDYGALFDTFVGKEANGSIFSGSSPVLIFMAICFVLNFVLIYRGLSKGIELFCRFAMPALVIVALIVLARVLTLDTPVPDRPQQSLNNGLGYMWNPVHEPKNIAPGDRFITALKQRSTASAAAEADDADGYLTFRVSDRAALAWALESAGWAPALRPDETGEPPAVAEGKVLAARYGPAEPAGSTLRLVIEGDLASFRGFDVEEFPQTLTPENAPVPQLASLLKYLPRDVADLEQQTLADGTESLAGFTVTDAAGFAAALAVTGWETSAQAPTPGTALATGTYVHDGSRIRLEVGTPADNSGVISAAVTTASFAEQLANPEIWLAAAGQIFFSLSIGFGVVITYASYMRRNDDVALSSVTAAAGNGFCEVALGGLIIIPATFMFLGISVVANPPGTFGMGFVSLPYVFASMPAGNVFGFLFFFLLFLAAVTSSLSMLQPAIALLEESLNVGRKASVAMLGLITLLGASFVLYFSAGYGALDAIDFWVGTFGIYVLATVQVILFGWVLGINRGMDELQRGAEIRLPRFLPVMIKYVAPAYLLLIFGFWLVNSLPARISGIFKAVGDGNPVELLSIGLILAVAAFFVLIVARAAPRWRQESAEHDARQNQHPSTQTPAAAEINA